MIALLVNLNVVLEIAVVSALTLNPKHLPQRIWGVLVLPKIVSQPLVASQLLVWQVEFALFVWTVRWELVLMLGVLQEHHSVLSMPKTPLHVSNVYQMLNAATLNSAVSSMCALLIPQESPVVLVFRAQPVSHQHPGAKRTAARVCSV